MGPSKLKRIQQHQDASSFEKGDAPPFEASFEELLAVDPFSILMKSNRWWGLAVDGEGAAILDGLVELGIRAALVGARAGSNGYMAALGHPADMAKIKTKLISNALGFGKQVQVCGVKRFFMPMGTEDFSSPPRLFDSNEDKALPVAFATHEAQLLAGMAAPGRAGGGSRL